MGRKAKTRARFFGSKRPVIIGEKPAENRPSIEPHRSVSEAWQWLEEFESAFDLNTDSSSTIMSGDKWFVDEGGSIRASLIIVGISERVAVRDPKYLPHPYGEGQRETGAKACDSRVFR